MVVIGVGACRSLLGTSEQVLRETEHRFDARDSHDRGGRQPAAPIEMPDQLPRQQHHQHAAGDAHRLKQSSLRAEGDGGPTGSREDAGERLVDLPARGREDPERGRRKRNELKKRAAEQQRQRPSNAARERRRPPSPNTPPPDQRQNRHPQQAERPILLQLAAGLNNSVSEDRAQRGQTQRGPVAR